jgi:hypothetical protein
VVHCGNYDDFGVSVDNSALSNIMQIDTCSSLSPYGFVFFFRYGDTVPRTALGKIMGAFYCLFGIIILALPVPILQDVGS